MAKATVINRKKKTKVFTFDVAFVLQVLAENEKEAQAICADTGGYVITREQTLRSVSDLPDSE